ncbi:MAG: hypothetical protein KDA78_15775, partial [Planctomycetaceae bacterium]|nr:hypothetical protein [Planctomycetaceae bacterium]
REQLVARAEENYVGHYVSWALDRLDGKSSGELHLLPPPLGSVYGGAIFVIILSVITCVTIPASLRGVRWCTAVSGLGMLSLILSAGSIFANPPILTEDMIGLAISIAMLLLLPRLWMKATGQTFEKEQGFS